MADESDDLDYLVALFKQEYATLHGFLARKTREPERVGDVLQNAVVSVHPCAATPSSSEFAVYVVRIVLTSLGGHHGAERTEGLGVVDLDAVLAESRELFTSTDVSAAILEQVTNSFPSSIHREIIRRAFLPGEVNANYVSSDLGTNKRDAARVLFRANRRLRVSLAQHELRNSLLDAAVHAATGANESPSKTEHVTKNVIESAHAAFEVDAWLVKWLQQPNPALQNQRPAELLRTRAGRQRLTHEYLRKLIRAEQDRLQLRGLLLEGARAAARSQPADAAYFERLRRMARGE